MKSIAWGILGIFILGSIVWMYTRSLELTTWITITFQSIKLVLYYYHERVWEKIRWGKKKIIVQDYTI